jgi:hypothetical protein
MASPEEDCEEISAAGYSLESIAWFLRRHPDWSPALDKDGVPRGVLNVERAIANNMEYVLRDV